MIAKIINRFFVDPQEIKQSDTVVARNEKQMHIGRGMDPVPDLRDILAEMSNNEALRYARQNRHVCFKLRDSIIDTNEEMKSMNRTREYLEKLYEHIRKAIRVNELNREKRCTRPPREKVCLILS